MSVINKNKYLISYDDFLRMYLFSGFLADFCQYVINKVLPKNIAETNGDLVAYINKLFNGDLDDDTLGDSEDAEDREYKTLLDKIDDEIKSCTGTWIKQGTVGLLRIAAYNCYNAQEFIKLGNSRFYSAIKHKTDGYIGGFLLDAEEYIYYCMFFRDVSEWCISCEIEHFFRPFIVRHGVAGYFYSTVLEKVCYDVLSGKLKFSADKTRGVLNAFINSDLTDDDNLDSESGNLVNDLISLSDKVHASKRMKKLILNKFSKSCHDSIKIACCNYIELWPVDYSGDVSERVRYYYSLFDSFFSWWNSDSISIDDKKSIVSVASNLPSNPFGNICKADSEYIYFYFPFFSEDGLFRIDYSLFIRYVDIFSYATDARFIVVFLRELIATHQLVFIRNGCIIKELENDESFGGSPIRRMLINR